MKILLFGFIAFCGWSSLSTYVYVCKIRGLCDAPMTMPYTTVTPASVISVETTHKTFMKEPAVMPKNLTIYFAFDKSQFTPDTVTERYFDKSNAYLLQNTQAKLSIIGNADAVGSDEYNMSLGYRRAQSMQHYFENKGIGSNRISIASKGEQDPAADNNTAAGRAKNRRTAITINK